MDFNGFKVVFPMSLYSCTPVLLCTWGSGNYGILCEDLCYQMYQVEVRYQNPLCTPVHLWGFWKLRVTLCRLHYRNPLYTWGIREKRIFPGHNGHLLALTTRQP